MGLCLFFLPNLPGATFIQGGTLIPDSRVTALIYDSKPGFLLVMINNWFRNIQTSQSTACRSLWILVISIEIPFSTYFLVTWQV